MENTDQTIKQINQINDFINSFGLSSYELSSSDKTVQNSISIPLVNGYQASSLLSRIEQLQPGSIHKPEEIAKTFNSNEHKYLLLIKGIKSH